MHRIPIEIESVLVAHILSLIVMQRLGHSAGETGASVKNARVLIRITQREVTFFVRPISFSQQRKLKTKPRTLIYYYGSRNESYIFHCYDFVAANQIFSRFERTFDVLQCGRRTKSWNNWTKTPCPEVMPVWWRWRDCRRRESFRDASNQFVLRNYTDVSRALNGAP